jgi:nucleoside-diphosphate-sugar epimerase
VRIAVTGASGFVGRYVLQALARTEGAEVVAVSRQSPGGWLPAGMRHVSLDLAALPPDPFAAMHRPDVLIHLAWSGLPNYQARHHFETHLAEQYRFLQQLVCAGLSSLLCTGTCFEYGMRSGALDESMTPDPRNAYGFAKDALRRQLEFLAADSALQLSWARLFYMYGEGQSTKSLYGQFLAAGERGDAAFPMSAGEQLRDYLHVEEVADCLGRLACHAPGAGIVNVCSGRPISVRALVEGWIQARGWQMKLDLGRYPYPAHEPMAFWGSNAKLISLMEKR